VQELRRVEEREELLEPLELLWQMLLEEVCSWCRRSEERGRHERAQDLQRSA
jgi:hypothetical protein